MTPSKKNNKIKNNMKTLELLAPAGSLQSFFAALENGADAVFCGLKSFSARVKAKNFSLSQVERMSGLVHEQKKKIYIALNTLIKEDELPSLVQVLSALEQYQVDGLIIQDLGLYTLVKQYFPRLPLHASTQMTIHNAAGVRVLEKMGFSRAVLARELSLQEIAVIRRQSSMELEHFVHGALCYSMSGHCLFSSYLDGRSGNRGGCVQPCRRKYSHAGESGFYFSTSDFSAIDLIPGLIEAGVMSFKIEGRMKSPDYVAAAVSAYRTVLDAADHERQAAAQEAKTILKHAMGRKSSQGFLGGSGGYGIVVAEKKGGIGSLIGKVERIQGKSISFKTAVVIHVGDRLRIQPSGDRPAQGFTLRSLSIGKKKGKRAGKGSFVTVLLPAKTYAKAGDTIFKLSTGKGFTMSEERAARLLDAAAHVKSGVNLHIFCSESQLTLAADVEGKSFQKKYPVQTEIAERSPLSEETLYKVFSHTGQKQLFLMELHAGELPPVVIKPSRLKEIRRGFYTDLSESIKGYQKERTHIQLQRAEAGLTIVNSVGRSEKTENLLLYVDTFEDLQVLPERDGLLYMMKLSPRSVQRMAEEGALETPFRNGLIWNIPSVVFDVDWEHLQAAVTAAAESGFTRFRLNNLSHVDLFKGLSQVTLSAGPWLYTLNNQTRIALRELGLQYCCTVLEDDRENLRALLMSDETMRTLVTVYSAVDLFTSRIKSDFGSETTVLKNEKGSKFPVLESGGLTITRAPKPFSLLGHIKELREMGCRDFIMDMRDVRLGSQQGKDIVRAFFDDKKLKDTSSFNFARGLS